MPRELGLSGNLWDGKTLATWIEREYGIDLGVRQCQRLFRQLCFRLRKPRPAVAQADPARHKAHKKKLQGILETSSVALRGRVRVQFHQNRPRYLMSGPPATQEPVPLYHAGRGM